MELEGDGERTGCWAVGGDKGCKGAEGELSDWSERKVMSVDWSVGKEAMYNLQHQWVES